MADLGVPVAVWRRLVDVAAAQAGLQVLTYLVPANADGAALDGQLVITVLVGSDPTARMTLTGNDLQPYPVGCQKSAIPSEQRFYAAASYSLIRPPRMGRRRILPRIGLGTGASGRGGRSCSARCGRCWL